MDKWMAFLNSLASRGGAVFLLTVIFAVGTGVSIHLIHHNEAASPLAASLMSTFAGFSGALLLALKGSSDSTASITTTPSGSTTVVQAGDTKPSVTP